jgi:hypothetical protein
MLRAMAGKTVTVPLAEPALAAGVKQIYGLAGDFLNGIIEAATLHMPGHSAAGQRVC